MQTAESGDTLTFPNDQLLVRAVVESEIDVYTGTSPITLILGHAEGAELTIVTYRDNARIEVQDKRPQAFALSFEHGRFETLSKTLEAKWRRERNPWVSEDPFVGYIERILANPIMIQSDSHRMIYHYGRCSAMLVHFWGTYPPRLYYRFSAFARQQNESWEAMAGKFR